VIRKGQQFKRGMWLVEIIMLVGTRISNAGHAAGKDLRVADLLVALGLRPKIIQAKYGSVGAKGLRHKRGPVNAQAGSALDQVIESLVALLNCQGIVPVPKQSASRVTQFPVCNKDVEYSKRVLKGLWGRGQLCGSKTALMRISLQCFGNIH
jgi:hypothetical protein